MNELINVCAYIYIYIYRERHVCIYIYIHNIHIYVYTYISRSLSLSLYIYIYIYMYSPGLYLWDSPSSQRSVDLQTPKVLPRGLGVTGKSKRIIANCFEYMLTPLNTNICPFVTWNLWTFFLPPHLDTPSANLKGTAICTVCLLTYQPFPDYDSSLDDPRCRFPVS